jgi:hypothetical protein
MEYEYKVISYKIHENNLSNVKLTLELRVNDCDKSFLRHKIYFTHKRFYIVNDHRKFQMVLQSLISTMQVTVCMY